MIIRADDHNSFPSTIVNDIQLEQSNSQLEKFAYVASHDIKEPIKKIRMFTERLQQQFHAELPDVAKQYLNKINAASGKPIVLLSGEWKSGILMIFRRKG